MRNKILILGLASSICMMGCSTDSTDTVSSTVEAVIETEEISTADESGIVELFLSIDEQFSFNDFISDEIFEYVEYIDLEVSDSVEITAEGTYHIYGSASNKTITVSAGDDDVQLILSEVDIENTVEPAIYIESADKVYITTEEGTENKLSTGVSDEESSIDAVIFSESDIVFNGSGSLEIVGGENGITSKDDLKIISGYYSITADGHGLEANDSIRIYDGTISINAGKDGIQVDTEDTNSGYIYIVNGDFDIVSAGDGISASLQVTIESGDFNIEAGGGSSVDNISSGTTSTSFGMEQGMTQQNMTQQGGTQQSNSMNQGVTKNSMGGDNTMITQNDMSKENTQMTNERNSLDTEMTPWDQSSEMMDEGVAIAGEEVDIFDRGTEIFGEDFMSEVAGAMEERGISNEDIEMAKEFIDSGIIDETFLVDVYNEYIGNFEDSSSDDSSSQKGIKAGTTLNIYSGTYNIDSIDDALHSDYNLNIYGGTINIKTEDDAIHAENDLKIYDGNIIIEYCYEGLEGLKVYVVDGYIDITSYDDGINVSSENQMSSDGVSVEISGGEIHIDSYIEGDGIDSNGDLLVSGGIIIISSTTVTTDTALDYAGEGVITGGTFFATGSNSQTTQNFSSDSTQGSIVYQFNSETTGTVTLTDSNGNVIISVDPVKEYQTIHISDPSIVAGETYTLSVDGVEYEIEMESLIYGDYDESSFGMNMMSGQMSNSKR